ncbi:DUF2868 domain-containing protein [Oceanobacter kriegii]|uniref:DUF2868 domain-containing protein n=1 Tax=Oceanobacter kriegii TaxID=64972 RepID=UPI0003F865D0|nr:DUF2868 domain-containing protein [Oceanobacter kriegii]
MHPSSPKDSTDTTTARASDHRRWTLADLVRFEQLRLQDQSSSQSDAELAQRDRDIYQRAAEPKRRALVYRFWLSERLRQQPLATDGGDILEHSSRTAGLIMLLIGLLSGAGLASSAMFYDGSVPVNVALFLALLVLPQLLLLVGLLFTLVAAAMGQNVFARWYQPLALLAQSVWRKCWKLASRHLSGLSALASGKATDAPANAGSDGSRESRDDAAIKTQLMQQMLQRYKPLMLNRVMRLFQTFGMGFNLGALACVLVLLAVTDRAFGWQSSLTASADTVHALVQWLATPWSWWLGEGSGYPSLAQIASTRIQLGSEVADFAADDFRTWWPFMVLSVLVYGLLPRLLVWGWAVVQEARWLRQPAFDGYHDQALWRRMQSVDFSSHSQPSQHTGEQADSHTPLATMTDITSTEPAALRLWVLEETLQRYPAEALSHWLQQASGSALEISPLQRLQQAQVPAGQDVWLVLEGWQPPIEETLQQLKVLAEQLQAHNTDAKQLHLVLLGKPQRQADADTVSKPLTARLAEVWRKKLDLLQCHNMLLHVDVGDSQ